MPLFPFGSALGGMFGFGMGGNTGITGRMPSQPAAPLPPMGPVPQFQTKQDANQPEALAQLQQQWQQAMQPPNAQQEAIAQAQRMQQQMGQAPAYGNTGIAGGGLIPPWMGGERYPGQAPAGGMFPPEMGGERGPGQAPAGGMFPPEMGGQRYPGVAPPQGAPYYMPGSRGPMGGNMALMQFLQQMLHGRQGYGMPQPGPFGGWPGTPPIYRR